MSYPIKQDIIPVLPRNAYRKGIGAYEGVVDHSTASPEATDENEATYFKREWNNRKAFPHFVVDWDSITQLADTNYICWASGNGNSRYVQIELCETKDPAKFQESYKRYVWLTAKLLKDKNLGVSEGGTLVSHDWVSKHLGGTNHVDPIGYLASYGISWQQHVANVAAEYKSYFQQSTSKPSIVYEAHIQDIGWQGKERNGETAGTVGRSLRLEALTVKLENSSARLEMEGHIQNVGWTSMRTNGEVIGTIGEGLRLEAVKIKANGLNVAYRVHVQNIGWTSWKMNGEAAGTTGQGLRIEAIEIKLV